MLSASLNKTFLSLSISEPDNWDVDWGWNEDESVAEADSGAHVADNANDGHHRWLQECIVSLSPTNDMVAFAQEDKICVLTRKFVAFRLIFNI